MSDILHSHLTTITLLVRHLRLGLCTTFQTRGGCHPLVGERWQSRPSFNQPAIGFTWNSTRQPRHIRQRTWHILKSKLTLIPIIFLIHGVIEATQRCMKKSSTVAGSSYSGTFQCSSDDRAVARFLKRAWLLWRRYRLCFSLPVSWYPSIMKTVSFFRRTSNTNTSAMCDTEHLRRSCSTTMRTSSSLWVSVHGDLWVWAAQISKNVKRMAEVFALGIIIPFLLYDTDIHVFI